MTLDLTAGRAGAVVADPRAGTAGDAHGGSGGSGGTVRRHPPVVAVAVARDLDRLEPALSEPVTAVRRAALVAHIAFLVEQARSAEGGPGRYPVALSRLGHEARLWARDPMRRPQVRSAARAAVLAWAAAGGSAAGTGTGPETGDGTGAARIPLRSLPAHRPTSLAYRYFWLLDDLSPDRVRDVTAPYSGPARWVLRNVLSGGYNRRAYLRWFGGGSGPAV
ncbi:hypothetical protein [Nakamurella sp.]|uniref:hypothetical protein n=1 Tax=Nakamurella sp. TaxID=1869182 RepID=UPI003B3A9958